MFNLLFAGPGINYTYTYVKGLNRNYCRNYAQQLFFILGDYTATGECLYPFIHTATTNTFFNGPRQKKHNFPDFLRAVTTEKAWT